MTDVKGQEFFARLRTFELACPRCDRVYRVGPRPSTHWDPRTSRFRCKKGCGLRLVLGILAQPVPPSLSFTPPDTIPTNWRHAAGLRSLAEGVLEEGRIAYKGRANRIITLACTCTVEVHRAPGCPVHRELG